MLSARIKQTGKGKVKVILAVAAITVSVITALVNAAQVNSVLAFAAHTKGTSAPRTQL